MDHLPLVVRHADEQVVARHPGVVDQDVDFAHLRPRLLDERGGVVGFRHVAAQRDGAAA